MEIEIQKSEEFIKFILTGEINELASKTLKDRFQDIFYSNSKKIILDFKNVLYIGSSGIGKILLFYKTLALKNQTLEIINTPPHILQLFNVLRLNTVFSIS